MQLVCSQAGEPAVARQSTRQARQSDRKFLSELFSELLALIWPVKRDSLNALRIVVERVAIVIFVTGERIEGDSNDSSTVQASLSMRKIERQTDGSLRVHVISRALAERLACALRRSASKEPHGVHPRVARDVALERLACALLSTEDAPGSFDETYALAVSVAIITRLITVHDSVTRGTERPNTGLQKWRLQRVIDYVDAHLAEAITLAETPHRWRTSISAPSAVAPPSRYLVGPTPSPSTRQPRQDGAWKLPPFRSTASEQLSLT